MEKVFYGCMLITIESTILRRWGGLLLFCEITDGEEPEMTTSRRQLSDL